jgi:hypothetical protein
MHVELNFIINSSSSDMFFCPKRLKSQCKGDLGLYEFQHVEICTSVLWITNNKTCLPIL